MSGRTNTSKYLLSDGSLVSMLHALNPCVSLVGCPPLKEHSKPTRLASDAPFTPEKLNFFASCPIFTTNLSQAAKQNGIQMATLHVLILHNKRFTNIGLNMQPQLNHHALSACVLGEFADLTGLDGRMVSKRRHHLFSLKR